MNTIAQKCRNPLNIRYQPSNKWVGQRGQYKGFCVFNSTRLGYRAALLLLKRYVRDGFDTIRDIVSRWAPPSENDTEAYIKFVCSHIDPLCTPDTKVVGTATLCMLCSAMAQFESGAPAPDPSELWSICVKYRIFVERDKFLPKTKYGKEEKCLD